MSLTPNRKPLLSVKIVVIDHYLTSPGPLDRRYSPFNDGVLKKVPVIRVFGSSENGQLVCLHIHQAYPYFYVPYSGSTESAQVQLFIYQLGLSINHALAIALNRNPNECQFIAGIILVKGIPFYGYHCRNEYFLKIYLLDPSIQNKLGDLLLSGAIMKTVMQPYELHIPYILQFMMDYNLYGMGWVGVEWAKIRMPVRESELRQDSKMHFLNSNIPPELKWSSDTHPTIKRESFCELEIDTTFKRIINRDLLKERPVDPSPRIPPSLDVPPSNSKYVPSLASIWDDERNRRHSRGIDVKIDNVASSMPDEIRVRQSQWGSEDELRRKLLRYLESKQQSQSGSDDGRKHSSGVESNVRTMKNSAESKDNFRSLRDITLSNLTSSTDNEMEPRTSPKSTTSTPPSQTVPTAFQSVTALYPKSLSQVSPQRSSHLFDNESNLITTSPVAPQEGFSFNDFDDLVIMSQIQKGNYGRKGAATQVEDKGTSELNQPNLVRKTPSVSPLASEHENVIIDELLLSQHVGRSEASPRKNRQELEREYEYMSGDEEEDEEETEKILNWMLDGCHDDKEQLDTPSKIYNQKVNDPTHDSPQKINVQYEEEKFQEPKWIDEDIEEDDFIHDGIDRKIDDWISQESESRRSQDESPDDRMYEITVDDIEDSLQDSPARSAAKLGSHNQHQKTPKQEQNRIPQFDGGSDDKLDKEVYPKKIGIKRRKVEKDKKYRYSQVVAVGPRETGAAASSSGLLNEPRNFNDFSEFKAPEIPRKRKVDLIDEMPNPVYSSNATSNKRTSTSNQHNLSANESNRSRVEAANHQAFQRASSSSSYRSGSVRQVQRRDFKQSSAVVSANGDQYKLARITRLTAPVKQNSEYFTNSLYGMWSPPLKNRVAEKGPFDDPPIPISPTVTTNDNSVYGDNKIPSSESVQTSFNHFNDHYDNDSSIMDLSDSYSLKSAYRYRSLPPTTTDIIAGLLKDKIPVQVWKEPFYSNLNDVSTRITVYAGKEFKIGSDSGGIKDWDWNSRSSQLDGDKWLENKKKWSEEKYFVRSWTPLRSPPSRVQVCHDCESEMHSTAGPLNKSQLAKKSQIEPPTQKNKFGFKFSQHFSESSHTEKQHLNVMSLEVHASCRGSLLPDPLHDPVQFIVYCLQGDSISAELTNGQLPRSQIGIITVRQEYEVNKYGICGYPIEYVKTEEGLFHALIRKVREFDPDIIAGYEIHNESWGYLIERAYKSYRLHLLDHLSRMEVHQQSKFGKDGDSWGYKKTSSIHVTGRIVLNIWRLMKSEYTLTSYRFENMVFHVLHMRFPHFPKEMLTKWYSGDSFLFKWRTCKYYIDRAMLNLRLLDQCDFINRTSEFARVFGIDFYSCLSRGSQFRVESMMLRIAKPENFVLISPNKRQVAACRAAECLPLVMEPESRFYSSPLLVLDFQSLYPSIMIAYNYCYSTCLGRVPGTAATNKLGVLDNFEVSPEIIKLFKDHINISPNGVVFVKPYIRQGILGRMLSEILDTRIMVKNSMKLYKNEKSLLKLLDARQLSLKYIANVTYGYTSANFSGRMPMVEIADSIVQTGRETLEKAIKLINNHSEWGARVVYGDTDSVFVYLPGATKERAFQIGKAIADSVTNMNPYPMKLKFEKVYHPCVLLAKKRYVGWKYESITDSPVFDAKGIETVRRDGCPVVAKMMERCLKLLFTTQDLSQIKEYVQRQFTKVIEGRVSLQDFIIAKSVKLGTYSNRGTLPPGALLSTKKMLVDKRSEPQYGERVPYVVMYGGPGMRLVDQVVSPVDFLKNKTLRLNSEYYITKQIIPPLERVFNLIGVDIQSWYASMPRVFRVMQVGPSHNAAGSTLEQYYSTTSCIICEQATRNGICASCNQNISVSRYNFYRTLAKAEKKYVSFAEICFSCMGFRDTDVDCESIDCPILYERVKAKRRLNAVYNFENKLLQT
ncbi:hypothetical protein BKA69DRAFT_1054554 [Paraphysoderma sedebokerense]|nr:hypothetical protein BKA69DRAFT_1054554 [Paraphysoderma sedebokerense]